MDFASSSARRESHRRAMVDRDGTIYKAFDDICWL
jgi:hypothetical protein